MPNTPSNPINARMVVLPSPTEDRWRRQEWFIRAPTLTVLVIGATGSIGGLVVEGGLAARLLADVTEGYHAMEDRRAIKTLLRV